MKKRAAASPYARALLKEQFAAITKRGVIQPVDQLLQRKAAEIGFPETRLTMKVHNSEPAAVTMETYVVGMLFYANHN